MDEAKRRNLHAQWDTIGEAAIRADMESGGMRYVGGTLETRNEAWAWLRAKEAARDAERRASDRAQRRWQRAGVIIAGANLVATLTRMSVVLAIGIVIGWLARGLF